MQWVVKSYVAIKALTANNVGSLFGEYIGRTRVSEVDSKEVHCFILGILFDIGLLNSSEIVEVQRSDLVSNFIGDTCKKTQECVKKAFGKVMFVDEAYTLYSKSEKDYGKEAIETLMRFMLPT